MKLITFQTMDAIKELFSKGYLECNEKFIDINKVGYAYKWILEKMNSSVENKTNTKYPLWCWVKFKNGICPPKHKGKRVDGFDVKITFNKDSKDVFVTDFRRYSFILNNVFIPSNIKEKEEFDSILNKNDIKKEDLLAYVRSDKYNNSRTDKNFLEICKLIRDSFDKCITSESDVLQGCIWRLNLAEIEKIEILKDDGYCYGSFNYVRSNGKRFDWINDYYKTLK